MRHFTVMLSLGFFAAGSAISAPAAAKHSWEVLTDCHLVANEFNDGDSFRVRSGEKEFVIRLYYVDAPEATLTYAERTREQSVHFGATLDATLQAGAQARVRVQELLAQSFVVRTRWANAPGRGVDPRYYVIVEVDGQSLAEILIAEGLARTKGVAPELPNGEKGTAYVARLRAMEQTAREKRRGLWAATATPTPAANGAAP